jgi:hypothetical protein
LPVASHWNIRLVSIADDLLSRKCNLRERSSDEDQDQDSRWPLLW